jgi:predicted outer membrane repeat protein
MVGSVVAGNSAGGIVGGGMALALSVVQISDSVIANNHIGGEFGSGGGFSNDSSLTVLERSLVTGNTSTGFGGAVVIASVQEGGESSVSASDSIFAHNEAVFGGAFAVIDGSALTLDRTALSGNQAAADGGAIWVGNFLDDFGLFFGNCDVTITDSLLADNSAGGNGGGIYVEVADSLVLDGVLVTLNDAGGNGGGLYIEMTPDVLDLSGAVIVLNQPDNVFVLG